jgi:hypothetical protein
MNGRTFDPFLGVFKQPDPLIQNPTNLQNYNRYTYCYDNGLICTDPSGFSFLREMWKAAPHNNVRRELRFANDVFTAATMGGAAGERYLMQSAFTGIQSMPYQRQIDRYMMTHEWA